VSPATEAELADAMFAMFQRLRREALRRRKTAVTREDWTAVDELERAARAVFSAQAWLLRSKGVDA
jgi:hypothetical protein